MRMCGRIYFSPSSREWRNLEQRVDLAGGFIPSQVKGLTAINGGRACLTGIARQSALHAARPADTLQILLLRK